ncbi:exosome complex component RRP40 [Nematocida minor]|uniref:exosome complex component RRP40 n=1 Tax=Nematocida minor TaxID=1912983 RepID=UPI00221F69CC|nr:exosome complex component RRP40 [Nematocida minor]KAI5190661.1 exosome complex component RRP40 [Nematocida minor]
MFVVPGEEIEAEFQNMSIGAKVSEHSSNRNRRAATSSSIGELLSLDKSNYWVNYKQAKYAPLLDDIVIGIVKGKGKETYKVDIGGPSYAIINYMDFPSVTKRNRINLNIGDAILAQVVDDSLHSETVISCKTEAIKGMGLLKGGAVIKVGILQCRKYLLHPPVLDTDAISIFAMNGYAWITPPTQNNIKKMLSLI